MLLKIDAPWQPVSLRGNYLTWKNPRTGETRKTYITEGQLKEVRQDLSKYNKLRQGLGYPWNPVRYDGEYIYYLSSVSGLETKSFVPPELRDIATQFLKATGEPGKAKVLTMTPIGAGKYEYIDRGNFTTLRDIATAEDVAKSPWMSHPYSIRQGTVTAVYEGNRIAVDGVIVSLRNTDTPIYAQDRAGWQAAKDYTTRLLPVGTQVTLKILTDMPRDAGGDTLADVTVANEDIAGKIMQQGHAPIKSAEPIQGLEWFAGLEYGAWAGIENLAQWGGTTTSKDLVSGNFGTWGNYTIEDRRTPGKWEREHDISEDRRLGRMPGIEELARRDRKYFIMDLIGDPMMYNAVLKTVLSPLGLLKPAYLKSVTFLNSFERPASADPGFYQKGALLWRQTMTLPRPTYHAWNFMGDMWNAMLGGLRDPRLLKTADDVLRSPELIQAKRGDAMVRIESTSGLRYVVATAENTRVIGVTPEGKKITVAEAQSFAEYYKLDKLGQSGETGYKGFAATDTIFSKLQKVAGYETERTRLSSAIDQLVKGKSWEEAFAHQEWFLINYNPKSLTAFEESYLYPIIPFYMFLRQNTVLQLTQIVAQPQTYSIANKLLERSRPTAEEYSRLQDYQKGWILIRDPVHPESFVRFRLPIETLDNLVSSMSTADKAILLTYPWLSAFPELISDRNFFDNTRPSKNYPLYIEKKLSSAYYYTARDYATLPLPEFLLKQLGVYRVTPGKAESDVSTLLQDAGYAKTMDMVVAENTQKAIKYETRRSANVQNLLATQTAIRLGQPFNSTYIKEDGTLVVRRVEPNSPGKPDIPIEFGGLDWLGLISYTEGAVLKNITIAAKYHDLWGLFDYYLGRKDSGKYYTTWDKVSVSDTNTFIRTLKETFGVTPTTGTPIEAKNSKYYWQESRGANYKPGWEGGFWDKLSIDVVTDFTNFISWGKDPLAKTIQYGNKELQLSSKGEKLYNTLRVTRGEFEAKWLILRRARTDATIIASRGGELTAKVAKSMANDLTIGKGLRIMGADIEIPYSAKIGSAFWQHLGTPLIVQSTKYARDGVNKISNIQNIIIQYLRTKQTQKITLEEFIEKYYIESSYSLTPGATLLSETGYIITGLYHGTALSNVGGILEKGVIEARVSNLDTLLQKVVSLTGSRSVAGSYGTLIFEVDPSLPVWEEFNAAVGKYMRGFEYRIGADVPLSKIKSAVINMGRDEDLSLKIFLGWKGRTAIYKTVGELKTQLESAGIETFVGDFNDIKYLKSLYYKKYPKLSPTEFFRQGYAIATILKNKLSLSEKIDARILDDILHETQNKMRQEIQARKAEIYILQSEAAEIWGTGYQKIVQKLLEDEGYRNAALWEFPRLKPVVDSLIMRNANIASMEVAWNLLAKVRTNYIFHEMMPDAIEAISRGKLKLPTAMDTASGREMLVSMGRVLNPYNLRRAFAGTVEEINAWSMKENGMAIFFEDAFGTQRTREELHVTSVAVRQLIDRIGKEFGKPLGALGIADRGYGISSIKQLGNVQLPKEVIRWLENSDLIKQNVPELAKVGLLGRGLQYFDFFQRAYKVGVTFGSPAWLQGNIQSGLWVDAKYAKAYRVSSYSNAWTEIARGSSILRWAFKMSDEGKVFTDIHGTQITAKELLDEIAKGGNLHSQGMTDFSTKMIGQSPFSGVVKTMYWALGASEDIVRIPLYFNARLNLGRSAEEANKIVSHYHGDYGLASKLSPFEKNVASRLLNFYAWDKFAPTLAIKEALVNPSSFTIPYQIMKTWNGQQGVTDKQYFTDRQMVNMLFRIPGTDAYTSPAIFSLANSVFKYAYTFSDKERGFYWEELQKDPNLILRFIKNDIDFQGGKVTIEGDKATITYVETGDSITAQLNSSSNKLTFTDWTGTVLREYPTNTIDGKVGIYKQLSPIERVERIMAELGAAAVVIPIELAVNRDFRFNNPITDRLGFIVNQFVGPRSAAGRGWEELNDPVTPTWEKWADMAIGWYVSRLSHNPRIPQQTIEDAVTKAVNIEVWKLERGDPLGCGY